MGTRPGAKSGQALQARVDDELSQLITQLTNEINGHMHQLGLSRADLASRMGVSPGRVSQVLSGGENLTLRTLASLATALGVRFELALRPRDPAPSGAAPGGDPAGEPARPEAGGAAAVGPAHPAGEPARPERSVGASR